MKQLLLILVVAGVLALSACNPTPAEEIQLAQAAAREAEAYAMEEAARAQADIAIAQAQASTEQLRLSMEPLLQQIDTLRSQSDALILQSQQMLSLAQSEAARVDRLLAFGVVALVLVVVAGVLALALLLYYLNSRKPVERVTVERRVYLIPSRSIDSPELLQPEAADKLFANRLSHYS